MPSIVWRFLWPQAFKANRKRHLFSNKSEWFVLKTWFKSNRTNIKSVTFRKFVFALRHDVMKSFTQKLKLIANKVHLYRSNLSVVAHWQRSAAFVAETVFDAAKKVQRNYRLRCYRPTDTRCDYRVQNADFSWIMASREISNHRISILENVFCQNPSSLSSGQRRKRDNENK